MGGSLERTAPPRLGGETVALVGVPDEARAALRADKDPLGVGVALLLVVEVDDEAQRPEFAHLRPEGMYALGARGQHAG